MRVRDEAQAAGTPLPAQRRASCITHHGWPTVGPVDAARCTSLRRALLQHLQSAVAKSARAGAAEPSARPAEGARRQVSRWQQASSPSSIGVNDRVEK